MFGMRKPNHILVFHPGAIGDVMLATPVASTLKHNFPDASLTYLTHPSLAELLKLSGVIDKIIGYKKEAGLLAQRRAIMHCAPDLIVDLSGSTRSRMLTLFSKAKVLRYHKQPAGAQPIQHAVDNFLATLSELQLTLPTKLFPTISPDQPTLKAMTQRVEAAGAADKMLVALVPGVGNLRSHRAWSKDDWLAVSKFISSSSRFFPILVGGPEEALLCDEIASATGAFNASGSLSLVQTAAMLNLCRLAVSGDTGPAHIAVAVGTPVIGLYGPTFPQRSGPYGCADLLIDHSHHCRCHGFKSCRVTSQPGPGDCMRQITPEEVIAKLEVAAQVVCK